MKKRLFQNSLALAGALVVVAMHAPSQDAANTANSSVPQLAYGVSDIVKLSQADVGDDTIVSYINQQGNSYGLGADQVNYLRQQGVSDAVITAMQNQPAPGMASVQTPTTAVPLSAGTIVNANFGLPPAPSITILPAIQAAAPPPTSFSPVTPTGVCVQTGPNCYLIYNRCAWRSSGVVVTPGIHAQGGVVANRGGFNNFGQFQNARSVGSRWRH